MHQKHKEVQEAPAVAEDIMLLEELEHLDKVMLAHTESRAIL